MAVAVSVIDWLEFRGPEREALKADVLRQAHLDLYHDEHMFSQFLYRGDSVEKLRAKSRMPVISVEAGFAGNAFTHRMHCAPQ